MLGWPSSSSPTHLVSTCPSAQRGGRQCARRRRYPTASASSRFPSLAADPALIPSPTYLPTKTFAFPSLLHPRRDTLIASARRVCITDSPRSSCMPRLAGHPRRLHETCIHRNRIIDHAIVVRLLLDASHVFRNYSQSPHIAIQGRLLVTALYHLQSCGHIILIGTSTQ
jgi:hypothetical protein